ncbi:hypothetical protein EBZ37_02510, partial [bacterium]|nr:hypothetical protein [bacterium]
MQISSRPTGTGSGLLIEINQPKKLNALDLESFLELDRLLRDAAANPSVSFVAIWAPTDSNPKAFCAGGDVRRLYDEFKKSNDLGYGSSFFRSEYQVDQRVWKFPKPLLAFTHG